MYSQNFLVEIKYQSMYFMLCLIVLPHLLYEQNCVRINNPILHVITRNHMYAQRSNKRFNRS